jgi:pSer/pThr/pTyr-binding forkhead associated (FHA) protein
MRASDAERDEVVSKLREEFAAGRLSQDTFLHRMNAVLEARNQADLPPLLADLPAPPEPAAPGPGSPPPSPAQSVLGRLRAAWPRRPRSGATLPPGAASSRQAGPVRRLTAGMPRAGAAARRPAPLQFPRGDGSLFSIGRDASCDLMITDMTVSRVHARLERTPDGWLLTDLASTNGTRVNGWRVHGQVPVRAGDRVSFGTAEYSLSGADGT